MAAYRVETPNWALRLRRRLRWLEQWTYRFDRHIPLGPDGQPIGPEITAQERSNRGKKKTYSYRITYITQSGEEIAAYPAGAKREGARPEASQE